MINRTNFVRNLFDVTTNGSVQCLRLIYFLSSLDNAFIFFFGILIDCRGFSINHEQNLKNIVDWRRNGADDISIQNFYSRTDRCADFNKLSIFLRALQISSQYIISHKSHKRYEAWTKFDLQTTFP